MMSDVELVALWETLCKMDNEAPIHIEEIVCSAGDLLDVIERAFVQKAYSQVT